MEINGVPIIKGEIHSIMTLIRLNTRWSSSYYGSYNNSYIHYNNLSSNTIATNITAEKNRTNVEQEEDAGIPEVAQLFRKLNEYLNGIFDIREVDCVMYILPFYQIIVSSKTNGPLTSAALSSLAKFALYGFLSRGFPRVEEGMDLLASSISNCVFEETDWESDELILMKLLELSVLCFRCDANIKLKINSAWDIYSTCLSIHNHYRASKILKSEAENALINLTLTAFTKVFQSTNYSDIVVDSTLVLVDEPILADDDLSLPNSNIFAGNADHVFCMSTGGQYLSNQEGVVTLLVKIMGVLSEMLDTQNKGNKLEKMRFSLCLLNIALEAGGLALG